jgi:hypothetical protein
MKEHMCILTPFRWVLIGLFAILLLAVGLVSTIVIGGYCLVKRENPLDHVTLQ